MPAIKTSNLTKSFGSNIAVDNLTLEINKGELYGLVGPDGAGKTTALRLLTAIMEPTSGDAWVAGMSVIDEEEAVREKIGYMSQRFGLYEDLTVMENILFYADLFDVPQKDRPGRIDQLMQFSGLAPFTKRLAASLSGGMKQKLGLACTLVHTPEVLFLDEPTNGVDPVSRRDFWRILYDLLKQGVTILVTTSYLDEAERCTRIGLIHKGKVLVEDKPKVVRNSLGLVMIEVWLENARAAVETARGIAQVKGANAYGDRLHITLDRADAAAGVIEALKRQGVVVKDHRQILPSLEDVFIAMVEK